MEEAGVKAEVGPETENPAILGGISGLFRQFAEWLNRRLFLGDSFSKRLLVGTTGFEFAGKDFLCLFPFS
jgi:hypothetical protein